MFVSSLLLCYYGVAVPCCVASVTAVDCAIVGNGVDNIVAISCIVVVVVVDTCVACTIVGSFVIIVGMRITTVGLVVCVGVRCCRVYVSVVNCAVASVIVTVVPLFRCNVRCWCWCWCC